MLNFFSSFKPRKTPPLQGELLRETVSYIKGIGRIPIDHSNLQNRMESVLKLLERYPDIIQIQRAGCHTISNVAMDMEPAREMMQRGAHLLIINGLRRFHQDDWRICWLGSSALWNLARPEEFRYIFEADVVDLVLQILQKYCNNTKVVNTAVGALSNLVLDPNLKRHLGKSLSLPILIEVTNTHLLDQNICCTAAGMLANLAVNDDIAHRLVQLGIVQTMTNILRIKNREPTFQRNSVAVLSNCLTSDLFLDDVLKMETVEELFDLMKNASNMGIIALVMNCLQPLNIDPEFATTSLHVCCMKGKIDILKFLVLKDNRRFDRVNQADERGYRPIIYAALHDHMNIVQFLVKCGACHQEIHDKPALFRGRVFAAVQESQSIVDNVRRSYALNINMYMKVAINSRNAPVGLDVAALVSEFLTPYSMIECTDSSLLCENKNFFK